MIHKDTLSALLGFLQWWYLQNYSAILQPKCWHQYSQDGEQLYHNKDSLIKLWYLMTKSLQRDQLNTELSSKKQARKLSREHWSLVSAS